MPEELAPPQLPQVNLESEPLKLGFQSIADSYALETVKWTFFNHEFYRQQNHDKRWNAHDALYFGWIPPRTWEGTTTPRATLSNQISFDQIESAIPAISQALFSDDEWFEVIPEPGNNPQEARGIQARIRYDLEHGENDRNAEIEIEHAIRQLLRHGNGGVAVEWDPQLQRAVPCWVDLRDLYVDPGCPTPCIDDSRATIRRRLMTVDELDQLRRAQDMNIPPRPVLSYMAKTPSAVFGDKTKQISEALRGVNYNPAQHEWSPLPADRRIEVLVYYSKSRIVWVLNREWVAYNQKNPYGFTPFCFAPCYAEPGRFYAQSFCDVLEGNQRYIEALMNAHLDELSLSIHPPRVKKRGSVLTPSQQRWRPGQIQEADDPKNDVVVQFPQGATANVMDDIAYMEAAAEKRTGVNSMGQGVPRGGNVNRTATGVNSQLQGGANRLWTIVKHLEDYLIVPMLYKMYKLTQYHTMPGQMLPALGQNDQYVQVGAEAFQKPCRFRILASSKMLTKEKLAQIFPFITQYILNGPFLQQLQSAGQTVDFMELFKMLQDATGTGDAYNLVRPMNQQEMQAKQQPNPELVMQQQLAQLDSQTRLQMGQMKANADIQTAQIQNQPDPQEAQREFMKTIMQLKLQQQKHAMDLQQQRQEMLMDSAQKRQELAHEQRKAQQQMLMDSMMQGHKLVAARQEHAQNLQMQREQAAQGAQITGAQAGQKMAIDHAAGQQKTSLAQQMGEHKMSMDKKKFAMDQERAKLQAKLQARQAKQQPRKAA